MNHPKQEKARICANILNSYANKEQLTPSFKTQEDFEKSLGESDLFYEEKVVENYLQDVIKSEDNEALEKAKKDIAKLTKKQVVDKNGKMRTVYVKVGEDKKEQKSEKQTKFDESQKLTPEQEKYYSENKQKVIDILSKDDEIFMTKKEAIEQAMKEDKGSEKKEGDKKSSEASKVLSLMDEDLSYKEALDKVLSENKDLDKAKLEKELDKYI